MRGMQNVSTPSSHYEGIYYSGQIHNYTWKGYNCPGNPANCWFWYYTRASDGLPIEQGEGCQVWPRVNCRSEGSGFSYLYHQFDPTSVDTHLHTPLSPSVFDIPPACAAVNGSFQHLPDCSFPGP